MDCNRKCNCTRKRGKANDDRRERRKERCTRLRQTLVFNPDEELYHEPYMDHLRDEYCPDIGGCTSGVELPWEEFAIGLEDIVQLQISNDEKEEEPEKEEEFAVRKESSGIMCLPWNDFLVKGTLQSEAAKLNANKCDSTLEIPWQDILYDPEYKIPKEDHKCMDEEVEIPWQELLIPKDLVLIPKRRKVPACYPTLAMPQNNSEMRQKKCGCIRRKK